MGEDVLKPFWDIKAITDALSQWCRIVDSRDLSKMGEVFAADLEWDFGHGTVDRSLAAVVARINAHLVDDTTCGFTQHQVSNMRVDLKGDDGAESYCYLFGLHAGIGPYEGQNLLMWGSYNDVWRRTSAGWRITKRLYAIDHCSGPMGIVYGEATAEMWAEGDQRRLD